MPKPHPGGVRGARDVSRLQFREERQDAGMIPCETRPSGERSMRTKILVVFVAVFITCITAGAAQSEVHAGLRRRMAGAVNRARTSCTNPLVPPHRSDGEVSHADGASLVCPPECGAGLVTQHPRDPDRIPGPRTPGQGGHQLRGDAAAGPIGPCRAGVQGSLPVRLPRHRRSPARARGGSAIRPTTSTCFSIT